MKPEREREVHDLVMFGEGPNHMMDGWMDGWMDIGVVCVCVCGVLCGHGHMDTWT